MTILDIVPEVEELLNAMLANMRGERLGCVPVERGAEREETHAALLCWAELEWCSLPNKGDGRRKGD